MHGILKGVMIAWSLTMHNAQLKKLKEIMTCTMVINNWVKYLYQVMFKRQIVCSELIKNFLIFFPTSLISKKY